MSERDRLEASGSAQSPWRLWGPYLAARQWGTVREDYSPNGDAWGYFPFEQARSRAYRWGEDGIAGICDRHGFLNFAVALWNGHDEILKERYFGLSNTEGNHGEDAKEYWWTTDGTPTHSWMRVVYRYPQAAYPYAELREMAARAGRDAPEPELADTGVLDGDRFFDVQVTYAKAAPDDICVEIAATNHGPDPAPLHIVPQLWFRNTWSWGRDARRPALIASTADGWSRVLAEHTLLGRYTLQFDGAPTLLVTDNETDEAGLFGRPVNPSRYTKAGIGDHIVSQITDACQVVRDGTASQPGTKAAGWYRFPAVAPGQTVRVKLRLVAGSGHGAAFGRSFTGALMDREQEADEFYEEIAGHVREPERTVVRRAYAGLLWTKQHYRFRVREWLGGDPAHPPAPAERLRGRNAHWKHVDVADVLSMPDEWEYPWFAAWDLAFHMVPFAVVDPAFAKDQILLLCREWLMHPDGQLPAYEWAFGDVNPPVHAWAALQVYRAEEAATGRGDRVFLARVFHKLLLNFSWWVNRKDPEGNYLFEGGFLGMDNIGPVNRSEPLPGGWRLEQSDATSWMATYALHLMQMALELAREDEAYEDVATKFVEHFLAIAQASTHFGSADRPIWDDEDGFCYDLLSRHHPDGTVEAQPVRVRSMVGLIPLLAVAPLPAWVFTELPAFAERLNFLLRRQPAFGQFLTWHADGERSALLSLLDVRKLQRVLKRMFDEEEFLAPHGIRSLSAAHRDGVDVHIDGWPHRVAYEPGESRTPMFGGNSNWRGPIWFPTNALLVQALHVLDAFHGKDLQLELPTGAGTKVTAGDAARDLQQRLAALFLPGPDGRRPADGDRVEAADSPRWREHVTFSEYFDGDTGAGLGASHQTGWTALVAVLIAGWPGTNGK
ncbi:MGH1-like glycoside hydrolase domain-containing protein [Actinokineospora sp. NPDC004072]